MGWGDCGSDSKERPVGYLHHATCDHPGCDQQIDRGLDYACGGMHGNEDHYGRPIACEGYFCMAHQTVVSIDGLVVGLCFECAKAVEDDEDRENNTPDAGDAGSGGGHLEQAPR